MDVPKDTTILENAYNELGGFWGVSIQVQDYEITKQHYLHVPCLLILKYNIKIIPVTKCYPG